MTDVIALCYIIEFIIILTCIERKQNIQPSSVQAQRMMEIDHFLKKLKETIHRNLLIFRPKTGDENEIN